MRKRRRKTFLMQLIEKKHGDQAIEQLMLDAYRQHGTEHAAAQNLGITQQSFNTWKHRLGLEDQFIEVARQRFNSLSEEEND